MKILFAHPTMPGQYKHLSAALAQSPDNQVLFLTQHPSDSQSTIKPLICRPQRLPGTHTHPYLIEIEKAVLQGQEAWRVCKALRDREGFTPDIICIHPQWGDALFLKDIYPDTPLLNYLEVYARSSKSNLDFDPEYPFDQNRSARAQTMNSINLLSLETMDWGVSPTFWQRSLYPDVYRDRITVLHDGIDTHLSKPNPSATFELPNGKILSRQSNVVTYVSRILEPYRGFHSFMRAAEIILNHNADCQIVIVGNEYGEGYGRTVEKGESYRQLLSKQVNLDENRIHFVGQLPHSALTRLFQISSAHIYLTYPFILSWSALEAMACGCAMVMSDTTPVTEVAQHNINALLVDFFSPDEIAEATLALLEQPDDYQKLRENARNTVLNHYSLTHLLPLQVQLVKEVSQRVLPPPVEIKIAARRQNIEIATHI